MILKQFELCPDVYLDIILFFNRYLVLVILSAKASKFSIASSLQEFWYLSCDIVLKLPKIYLPSESSSVVQIKD